MAGKYPVRSISLPSRSHPTTVKIEEELSNFRISDESSGPSICSSLSGFELLYNSLDDLLTMGSTQQVLSQNGKPVDELLEESVKLLDVCGMLNDVVSQIKEHVQSLQSALRRRKGDSTLENNINSYVSYRRKMKKDVKKLISSLKHMENGIGAPLDQEDIHLTAVIRVLREVNVLTSSLFQSVLTFLSPSGSKQSKWSLVSRLMHKGAVGCETVNELENVDVLLLSKNDAVEKVTQQRLKELEISIEGIEKGLESVFRRLIRTRASLLNIISQ